MAKTRVLPFVFLVAVTLLPGCDPLGTDVYLTNKTGREILYAPLEDSGVGSFVSVPGHERLRVENGVWHSLGDAVIKDALTGKVISKVHYGQHEGTGPNIEIAFPPAPPARYFEGTK
jgi:hypothetical protein